MEYDCVCPDFHCRFHYSSTRSMLLKTDINYVTISGKKFRYATIKNVRIQKGVGKE
jgi:hypothetical protein